MLGGVGFGVGVGVGVGAALTEATAAVRMSKNAEGLMMVFMIDVFGEPGGRPSPPCTGGIIPASPISRSSGETVPSDEVPEGRWESRDEKKSTKSLPLPIGCYGSTRAKENPTRADKLPRWGF